MVTLYLHLLGSFEVLLDGRPVGPGPEALKPRMLLALLALRANSVVSKESLIDDLWLTPPVTARNVVEKYVSLWRKALGPQRLQTVGPGYRLQLSVQENELEVLAARLAEGQRQEGSGHHEAAEAVYRRAFEMWSGSDVEDHARALLPQAEAQRLIDLYLRSLEGWAAASLAAGGEAEVTEPLRLAWDRQPYREHLAELLMWSYYQQGRQSEAIAVYGRVRAILAEELGQDPGMSLQQMHTRVLRQDPSLAEGSQCGVQTVVGLPMRSGRFTGRGDELQAVQRALEDQDTAVSASGVAVWGPVGIGKTALAMEFARRHHEKYDVMWYVNATTRTSVADDLEKLANRLGVPLPSDREGSLHLLWDRLLGAGRWLLIFDDARRPQDLVECWPPVTGGDVVVTSLNPDWGQLAQPFELKVLTRSETVALLEQRTGRTGDVGDDELAAELDGLPLACEQAAAYIGQTGMTATEYIQLFRRRRMQLLERGAPDDHVGTIATTWRLAQAELVVESPGAVALILLCAHLAAEDIPLALLRASPEHLPKELRSALCDDVEVEDLIREARRYSLLGRQGDHLRMHRLLQAVVTGSLPRDEARAWQLLAASLVAAWAPASATDTDTWAIWQQLVPHATRVAETLEEPVGRVPHIVEMLHRTSEYLVARGSFDDASTLLRSTLRLLERDDPNVDDVAIGQTLTELGEVLLRCERSGEPDGAVLQFERALTCLQRRSPPDSPWVARASAGLAEALTCHSGVTLWATEALPEVEQRFVRALSVLTSVLGSQHPAVAQALSGLGQIRQDRGDVAGGIECQERALEIVERSFGADHPDVGHLHDKLGYALGLLGQVERARASHERALEVLTRVYGEGHAETGWPLSNLGMVLLRADLVAESIRCQRRAHEIFSTTLGDVTATQIAAWRLAQAELKAGRPDQARALLRHAVSRLEAELGPGHPDVIHAAADLDRAGAVDG